MKINRPKHWWITKIKAEPTECNIGAGAVPKYPAVKVGKIGMIILSLRAKFAWMWRIGLIKRTTAFRWEMDRFLGEWSK